MSTIERLEGKQQATEDILGEVQKALDFLYMAVDSLEASGLFEMNENVRQSKGQHEVTEDFSVDVQEALGDSLWVWEERQSQNILDRYYLEPCLSIIIFGPDRMRL